MGTTTALDQDTPWDGPGSDPAQPVGVPTSDPAQLAVRPGSDPNQLAAGSDSDPAHVADATDVLADVIADAIAASIADSIAASESAPLADAAHAEHAQRLADPGADTVHELATWERSRIHRDAPPHHGHRPARRRTSLGAAVGLVRALPRATLDMLPMWVMHKSRRHAREFDTRHLVASALVGAITCTAALGALLYMWRPAMLVEALVPPLDGVPASIAADLVEPPLFDPTIDEPLRVVAAAASVPAEGVAAAAVDRGDSVTAHAPPARKAARPRELTSQQIIEVVGKNAPSIGSCVRRARLAGELAPGSHTLELSFTVRADAGIDDPSLAGPGYLAGTSFAACVQSQVRQWRFPTSRSPSRVKSFPLPIRVR